MDGVVVTIAASPPLLQIAFLAAARANEFHMHHNFGAYNEYCIFRFAPQNCGKV
jgi:hypothetical protein